MNQLLILADGKGRIKAFSLSKRQEKNKAFSDFHANYCHSIFF